MPSTDKIDPLFALISPNTPVPVVVTQPPAPEPGKKADKPAHKHWPLGKHG